MVQLIYHSFSHIGQKAAFERPTAREDIESKACPCYLLHPSTGMHNGSACEHGDSIALLWLIATEGPICLEFI